MASIPITIVSIGHVFYAFLVSLSIFLISSSNKVFAVGGGQTFHTIQVTSLLPSSVCSPSTKEPTFNPSSSKSYRNITCDSPRCSQLASATGVSPRCATTTCVYGIQYGDSSFSVGLLGSEKLTLTPSDVFPRFIFGCGKNNQGLFRGAAGLLGLDRGPFSTVSQTAFKYGKYFSYCLPSDSSSTGTLTFGKGGTKSTYLKFTPLLVNPKGTTFYFVDIVGIEVGGQKLPISESVFKTPGTIVDSGTVITRLQPGAYAALRTSFREATKDYNRTEGVSILDTCYDFTGYDTVRVPTISFLFARNIEVPIDVSGILVYVGSSRYCLAFAGNSDASDVGIFGNVQQQTLDVVYDVAGGKIGCYNQREPIFNPSASKSYRNITCDAPQCSQLTSATGVSTDCSTATCAYDIQDGGDIEGDSSSVGFLGYEKLTITPSDVFPNFIFGCGRNNQYPFYDTAGLLGLSRDPLSAVSQTASKYGKYFSYCLPTPVSTGTLTFGKGGTTSKNIKFTPSPVNPKAPSFYFVDLIGIKVGGRRIPVSESVFKTPGTIIDTGTVITRLPSAAYAALRTSFLEATEGSGFRYGGFSFLDTCYNYNVYDAVKIPTISFLFGGNIEVPISDVGILYFHTLDKVCLSFAGNSDASDVSILGSLHQETLDVVYDIAGEKIGFGTGGCS
ncbi:hypothetical protein RHGRI_005749 [Rhododendron griersonianum]|uniref:Peptidase A1 domain-containing protein n=1 Tax=Rhododendron griersonianum TaxID=479676 RepID=A0AAV6LEJ6_9ERIC|nr:hypothetical protein RHGRI_005749 [Rhododendron griersonianum]